MTIDPAFAEKMKQNGAQNHVPWRIADHDGRVVLVNANGRVMVAVEPAQIIGKPTTRAERLAIGQFIVDAVSKCPTP